MRKIYSLVLIAVGLLISGSSWAQGEQTWPAQFENDEAAVTAGAVAKIGDQYYSTLALAVADALTDGTQTTIVVVNDIVVENCVKITEGQNIILELNGKIISQVQNKKVGDQLILNQGILTIQDAADTQYDGTGGGKITTMAYVPDMGGVPGYATNTILNNRTLYIKSGLIENQSEGTASYAIDNDNRGASGLSNYNMSLTMSGGAILSNQSNTIRMYLSDTRKNDVVITGGKIGKLWVQDGSANNIGSLSISNADIIEGLKIGYDNKSEHFSFSVTNSTLGGVIIYGFDSSKDDNSIAISGTKAGSLYMECPAKILSDGLFKFDAEIKKGWVKEADYDKYPASDGWRLGLPHYTNLNGQDKYIYEDETEEHNWETAYITPQGLTHIFYQYIVDGYGLVARPDVGEGWYEIALTQGTTDAQDVEGHDGVLGNPWHKNKTWDLTKENVVPEETTPVLIDHNVYVEENSQAIAASLQIEAGQTLTVKNGATLQILDAGALFKDATAKLVIEPKAVVTVGSNGIIADDVENIVIQSDANGTGVLLMNPGVTINTRPLATVKMFTNAGNRNNKWWWQHFGIPTSDAPTVSNDRNVDTYVQQWVNSDWEELSAWSQMKTPFLGYNLTNSYEGTDGVTYSFTGNLVGNNDAQLNFVQNGYNLMANSYTGPLDLKTMFEKLSTDLGDDVEITAWVYKAQEGQYLWVNSGEIEMEDAGTYTIAPMQGFILRLINGTSAQGEVDYTKSIWENPHKVGIPLMSPARQGASDVSKARVVVSANGKSDLVKFYQKDEYSGDFENGYDASKYMNDHFNLFVESGNENLATVASNDMNGLYLTLQADENAEYTLSFENVNDFDYSILDIQTGITTPMVEGATYDFVASPNTTISNRFQIVSARTTPTTLDNVKAAASRNGVYTVLGQFVGKKADFNKLPAGVYVVDGQRIVK